MYVTTIPAMKSLAAPLATEEIFAGGYWNEGDGGGGHFIWKPTVTPPAEDGGLVIYPLPSSPVFGTGYYKRLIYEDYLNVKWFGARGDNSVDDWDPINRALNSVNVGMPPNMGVGGYDFPPPWLSIGPLNGSMTRIFFPAGVYKISNGFFKHPAWYLEIYGDRAILLADPDLPPFAVPVFHFEKAWFTSIKNMQFWGCMNAIKLDSFNLDGGTVVLEELFFSKVSGIAIDIICQSSYVGMKHINWRDVRIALDVKAADKCVVDGGWITPTPFTADYQSPFVISGGGAALLQLHNIMCIDPAPDYNYTGSWVKIAENAGGSVILDKMRCGAEHGGMGLVNSWQEGNWSDQSSQLFGITIKDCAYATPGPLIRLFKVPNYIVMEDNKGSCGWLHNDPAIWFDSSIMSDHSWIRNKFSIKLDNIVSFWRAYNTLYPGGTAVVPHPFLPYLRVNNGLVSYGYAFWSSANVPLVFFGGINSEEAIKGYFAFEVDLVNNFDDGFACRYNQFRIEVERTGSTTYQISNLINITNNPDPEAPILRLVLGTNLVVLDVNNLVSEFVIIYQIRNLISPNMIQFPS